MKRIDRVAGVFGCAAFLTAFSHGGEAFTASTPLQTPMNAPIQDVPAILDGAG